MIDQFWRRALAIGTLTAAALCSAHLEGAAASVSDDNSAALSIGTSQPGNYLAGLIASADRNSAAAETYYREALRLDPRNPELIERAFSAALSNGDVASAAPLRNACWRATRTTGLRGLRCR